jgi:hypothetical protein
MGINFCYKKEKREIPSMISVFPSSRVTSRGSRITQKEEEGNDEQSKSTAT